MTSRTRRRPSPPQQRPEPTLGYGDDFGPYVITGFAGCGATSYVYRARRRDRFEPVAIKVLHPHLVADPTRRLSFYREARIMMRMDHPNVVRFEEIIERGNTLAFVMEYVDGVTLDEWRTERGERLDEATLARVFVDVLRGVSAAHRQGVIHRDLKPGNIMIGTEQGRAVAKIIDFGVARLVDQAPTDRERSKIIGTAAYISPEEVGDPQAVCPASDLYSIGVMLYEAACGRRPFDGMELKQLLQAHVRRRPPRPGQVNPALSEQLEQVILQTLDKRPDDRYASGPEMIGALERVLRGPSPQSRCVSEPDEPIEQMKTTRWERPEPAPDPDSPEPEGQWTAIGGLLRRCLEAASVLVPSTGAEDGDDPCHYLNRTPGPGMPFG